MGAHVPLREIAAAFAIGTDAAEISRYGRGRINDTYRVRTTDRRTYILQRLHPIFGASVLDDHLYVSERANTHGIALPKIIPTRTGDIGLTEDGRIWRMLTFIPGQCFERSLTPARAESAGALVGRFHACFADDPYRMRHVRPGFHASAGILRKLRATILAHAGEPEWHAFHATAFAIASGLEAALREPAWEGLPDRIIHGDLKLSNVRFARDGRHAAALLDLDTMANASAIIDLSDAARSWANPGGEDDPAHARFDCAIFAAMMRGYLEHAALDHDERAALPNAILCMTLELAARFATDALERSYFRLDHRRYRTLFEQNAKKAETQLALARSVRAVRAEIFRIALSR